MGRQVINLMVTLMEDMLGTVPKNKDIFADHIQSKAVEKGLLTQQQVDDEIESVEEMEEKGQTGFMKDEGGLFIYDYLFKGFVKEAGNTLKEELGIKGLRNKIGNFLFVFPRKIYLGKMEPDGTLERPLQTNGPHGARTCLAKSDIVCAGTTFNVQLTLLPHKEVTRDVLIECLNYGQLKGLGQFRNGSYGRFSYEIVE